MASRTARGVLVTLVCAFAAFAAGCHRPNNISGYGLAWVTLTSEPGGQSTSSTLTGDYTNYTVTIDSMTLTRNDGVIVTALATPEIVDFTQLKNNSELWGTATIPTGTYLSATIVLDYSAAVITAMVGGVPTTATVLDTTGATPTTFTLAVTFDTANPLIVTPTYASTSATRFALDLDLSASGYLTYSGTTLQAIVSPYMTAGVLPSDSKLIRVRGPLINSNNTITTGGSTGTYSVYVRPFYDVQNNLGALSLFSTANTIFTINGTPYTGNAGITALAQLSAGSTMTAAYTTFVPDFNAANAASSGTFYPVYVVAGSTLEDNYTEGIEGDVIARSGNTLTVRGSTVFINEEALATYETFDTNVLLGTGTLVTADDTTLTGLNYNSIAVGQHIVARGVLTTLTTTAILLDATGTQQTDTGSVRLIPTELYGSLVSTTTGGLTMNVANINNWPVSIYNFTGNGTSSAGAPTAANFSVDTGSLALPADLVAGGSTFVDGRVAAFGSAPPAFTATDVNSQSSVQLAGGSHTAAGTQACGLGSLVCEPAQMRVLYKFSPGTASPFASLSATGFSVDMTNAELLSAKVRIGAESIDLTTLSTNVTVVPTSLPNTSTFGPQYTVGNPVTSTITTAVTTASTTLHTYSVFSGFVSEYTSLVSATNPVVELMARGVYDSTTNTFTATDIDVVL